VNLLHSVFNAESIERCRRTLVAVAIYLLVYVTGLEDCYDEVDKLWRKRLEELQVLLADRELFHADVDRCLRWLKEADIVTFPEVNLAASLSDLESHLGRYEVRVVCECP